MFLIYLNNIKKLFLIEKEIRVEGIEADLVRVPAHATEKDPIRVIDIADIRDQNPEVPDRDPILTAKSAEILENAEEAQLHLITDLTEEAPVLTKTIEMEELHPNMIEMKEKIMIKKKDMIEKDLFLKI